MQPSYTRHNIPWRQSPAGNFPIIFAASIFHPFRTPETVFSYPAGGCSSYSMPV